MLDVMRIGSLVAATITTGLMAGLFFAYAVSVMPGLARGDDRTYAGAMQEINVAIVNGWFLLAFLGALVLTALAAVLHLGAGFRPVLPWIVAGLVLYVVALAITFGINIPLNNELAAAGEPDRIADLAAIRERFESSWVRWNIVRMLASTAAFGVLTWGLVQYGRFVTD